MKSLYIHIPFCKHICTYCDFAKVYYNSSLIHKYLESLKKEVLTFYKGEVIETIYIGGGTPSSLSINELEYLFEIISLIKVNDPSISFECNVEDINDSLLLFLKEHGVNRLSIGVESFNDEVLSYLGRDYNGKDAYNNVLLAKKYFDNISIDLMYAIKNQTLEMLENDLDKIIELGIPHVSTYSLIIEPHTQLYNEKTVYVDSDLDRMMYDLIIKKLAKYNHYEVSNFALDGYESKHNLTYWNNDHYYGFGLGAGGYVGNMRYANVRSLTKYIDGDYKAEEDELNDDIIMENEFILGLRKIDGINKEAFKNKFHKDILSIEIVKKLLKENKLIDDGSNIKIKYDLIYTSNAILIDFIGMNMI